MDEGLVRIGEAGHPCEICDAPNHVYQGVPPHGAFRDGEPLPLEPSLRVWNHSPTGFSWGYAGSGPAQLSLAILLCETSEDAAVSYHQRFKFDVVAGWPGDQPWRITSAEIHNWLLAKAVAEANRGPEETV